MEAMNNKISKQIIIAVSVGFILNILTAAGMLYQSSVSAKFEGKENTKDIQELKTQCEKKADKSMILNIEDKWESRFNRLEDKIDIILQRK